MKKKVVVIAVALMTIAMLAVPVMAEPTKGQKVPAKMYILGFYSEEGEGYSARTTNGGIVIVNNNIVVYDPILLFIGDNPVPLTGKVVSYVHSVDNTKQLSVVIQYDTDMSFSTSEGGFKGKMYARLTDMYTPDWYIKWNIVLHGYGAFEGQILQMSTASPYPNPVPASGYLLKP